MGTTCRAIFLALALLICGGEGICRAEEPPASGGTQSTASSPFLIGEDVVFRFRVNSGNHTPDERVLSATRKIDKALRGGSSEVRVVAMGGAASVHVGPDVVLVLSQADAQAEGREDLSELAEEVATRTRRAIKREKNRRTVAERVLGASGVVFFGILGLLLIQLVGRLSRSASRWVTNKGESLRAVRLGAIELLPATASREGLRIAIFAGAWLVRAGIAYSWILAALSLFATTRPLVGRAAGYLFTPAIDLLGRLASRLPLVLALFLALLVVISVIRFVTLYAVAVQKGEIESDWLRPETARITGTLLAFFTCLLALLFVTPLLTGDSDGSLTRVGLLGLGALALAATPLLASCVLGARVVYGGMVVQGGRVEYGGQKGVVANIGLFDLMLSTEDGARIRVPHLMSLWHVTRVFPAGGESGRPEGNP